MTTHIYCAAGNRRFAEIAIGAGFMYGARLPDTVYFPLHFADQNWKKPDRTRYMAGLAEHRPTMATVLDWEHEDQLPEVLSWAEEAAQYVSDVLIIPKVSGVHRLPREIGGARVVLGFSVPTRHGGTSLLVWEFAGWPVHLLGGSPQQQMRYYRAMHGGSEVVSTDGNYAHKMALRYVQYWVPGTARGCKNRWWPQIQETDGWAGEGAPYEAFRRSCENIAAEWRTLTEPDRTSRLQIVERVSTQNILATAQFSSKANGGEG